MKPTYTNKDNCKKKKKPKKNFKIYNIDRDTVFLPNIMEKLKLFQSSAAVTDYNV